MAKGDLHRLQPHQEQSDRFKRAADTNLFRETGEVRPVGPEDAGTWSLSPNGVVCLEPAPVSPIYHIDGLSVALMAGLDERPKRILEPAFDVDPETAASIQAPPRKTRCGDHCKVEEGE